MTGYAFATAFAAPVEDGMIFAEAARPARQSFPFIELSTTIWEAVAACTVAELFIDDLHNRCKAVGRARRARNHLHIGLVIFRVDAYDDGWCLSVLCGCRYDHFLRSSFDVFHATFGGSEGASGLADVINTGLRPRNLSGITRGRKCDRKTVYLEAALGQLDSTIEAAVDSVVL